MPVHVVVGVEVEAQVTGQPHRHTQAAIDLLVSYYTGSAESTHWIRISTVTTCVETLTRKFCGKNGVFFRAPLPVSTLPDWTVT